MIWGSKCPWHTIISILNIIIEASKSDAGCRFAIIIDTMKKAHQ